MISSLHVRRSSRFNKRDATRNESLLMRAGLPEIPRGPSITLLHSVVSILTDSALSYQTSGEALGEPIRDDRDRTGNLLVADQVPHGEGNRRNYFVNKLLHRDTATTAFPGFYQDSAGIIVVYRRFSATAEFYASMGLDPPRCRVPGSLGVHVGVTANRVRLSGNRRSSASSSPEGDRSPCGSASARL